MGKFLIIFSMLFSSQLFAQNDIPEINWKIVNYLDSLRTNNVYDVQNLVEKALLHVGAKQPDGNSYGQEYSDLHEVLPGDIYFISNYFEFEELPPDCPKQQRRDQNDIDKVDFISIEQYKIIQIALNGGNNQDEKEILKMLLGIEIDSDNLHFYHPKPLF